MTDSLETMKTSPKLHQSRVKILEGIARGEAAFRAGRVLSHEQVVKRIKRRLSRKVASKTSPTR
jgi:predicted transcriptional regulator